MKLPVVVNKYTSFFITFDLGIILDGYNQHIIEFSIDNSNLYNFYKSTKVMAIIEINIRNWDITNIHENNVKCSKYKIITAEYLLITTDALYKTDGISTIIKLSVLNTKLLDDLYEFIATNVEGGFEVYKALNIINKLRKKLNESNNQH